MARQGRPTTASRFSQIFSSSIDSGFFLTHNDEYAYFLCPSKTVLLGQDWDNRSYHRELARLGVGFRV